MDLQFSFFKSIELIFLLIIVVTFLSHFKNFFQIRLIFDFSSVRMHYFIKKKSVNLKRIFVQNCFIKRIVLASACVLFIYVALAAQFLLLLC